MEAGTRSTGSINLLLQSHQCRLTPQREAVLLTLLRKKNGHFTPYELFLQAKESCPELGLATVYRALKLFTRVGLVREVKIEKGMTFYEYQDPDVEPHYHLICKRCGCIVEVASSLSQRFTRRMIENETGFLVTECSCCFYGYCANCRESIDTKEDVF